MVLFQNKIDPFCSQFWFCSSKNVVVLGSVPWTGSNFQPLVWKGRVLRIGLYWFYLGRVQNGENILKLSETGRYYLDVSNNNSDFSQIYCYGCALLYMPKLS